MSDHPSDLLQTQGPDEPSRRSAHDEPTVAYSARSVSHVPPAPQPELRVGAVIGSYTLVDRLGEGGFGIVFLAERTHPFTQRVALKILKPGMGSDAVLARFEQERQALALMDHPNVARVFDAGSTERGLPYFVMELVQGEAITAFCERHRLDLRQRLELLIPVCEAVQHAHTKGIVHRDLKPSNVLVSQPGDTPTPKVIDFGVAKALSRPITDKEIFTEAGQMVGTPEYMSPEQTGVGAMDIDTRTDVYSLGVILYELLTGVLPFDPRDLRKQGYGEIQRIIREVEPPRPSVRLTTISKRRELPVARPAAPSELPDDAITRGVAARLGTSVDGLARWLRGDLDWIVMKAMEKDRERRYRSPADLADDLRRYLSTEPVTAGPPSASYRALKFVRRNRLLVSAAAICAVAVFAGLGLALFGLHRARVERNAAIVARDNESRQRRAAEDAQNAERQERLRAESASRFIQKSVERANPWLEPSSLSVRELLDEMSQSLEVGELDEDPGQKLAVLETLGPTYTALGEPREAQRKIEEALDLVNKLGAAGRARADSLSMLLASSLNAQGQFTRTLEVLAETGERARRDTDMAPAIRLQVLHALAIAQRGTGARDNAERTLREALDIAREAGVSRSLDAAMLQHALGVALMDQPGKSDESLDLVNRSLATRVRVMGDRSPLVEIALTTKGRMLHARGDMPAAESALRQALQIAQSRGAAPSLHGAATQQILADLLRDLGNPDESRRLAEAALRTRRELRASKAEITESLNLLGGLALDLDKPAEAERIFREELQTQGDTGEPVGIARALTGLGDALARQKQFAEARDAARRALDLRRKFLPAQDARTAYTQAVLGAALTGLGQFDEAEKLLVPAGDLVLSKPQLSARRQRAVVSRVIEFYEASGRTSEAEAWRAKLPSANRDEAR